MTRNLESEIEQARRQVSADSVSMTITELSNLYLEGVLQIQPEFQRLFRWSQEQKSRLIESILLGIPLPSLFVSQSDAGKWELVDGLQRVSTIFQLQGILGDMSPLTLSGTKYLPHLENYSWDGFEGSSALTEAQKLDIRLARLDIKVIRRSSDRKAKFDLFQRLNSFGSVLTAQEIRSAMIAGLNSSCLQWLIRLAQDPNFLYTTSLSDRQRDEQYDIELVLRFLMLHNLDSPSRSMLADFPAQLNDWSANLAESFDAESETLEETFTNTFAYLGASGDENLFRRWDENRKIFRGGFLNTSFEVIALGAGYWVAAGFSPRGDAHAAARELSKGLTESSRFATGLATADRLVKTLPLGRRLMSDPPGQIEPGDL